MRWMGVLLQRKIPKKHTQVDKMRPNQPQRVDGVFCRECLPPPLSVLLYDKVFVECRSAKIHENHALLQKLPGGPAVPLQPVADMA